MRARWLSSAIVSATAACSSPGGGPVDDVCRSTLSSPEPAVRTSTTPIAANGGPLCMESGWCWARPGLQGAYLLAAFGYAANDLWVGGGDGQILHFDGRRWSLIPSDSTKEVRGLWGPSPGRMFAITRDVMGGELLELSSGRFRVIGTSELGFGAIYGHSERLAWAMPFSPSSRDGPFVFDGERWTEDHDFGVPFSGISAAHGRSGYVAFGTLGLRFFELTGPNDGGGLPSIDMTGNAPGLGGLAVIGPDRLIASVSRSELGAGIARLRDGRWTFDQIQLEGGNERTCGGNDPRALEGGATAAAEGPAWIGGGCGFLARVDRCEPNVWSRVPLETTYTVNAIASPSEGVVVAAGGYGLLARRTDEAWIVDSRSGGEAEIFTVDVGPDGRAWAGGQGFVLARTGDDWSIVHAMPGFDARIVAAVRGGAYAAYTSSTGASSLFSVRDEGAELITPPFAPGAYALAAAEDGNLFLHRGVDLYEYDAAGDRWMQRIVFANFFLYSEMFLDPASGDLWISTGMGRVEHFDRTGRKLDEAFLENAGLIRSLIGNSATNVYALGDRLFHYDGLEWTEVRLPPGLDLGHIAVRGDELFGFLPPDPQHAPPALYRLRDGMAETIPIPMGRDLQELICSRGECFLLGERGTILDYRP